MLSCVLFLVSFQKTVHHRCSQLCSNHLKPQAGDLQKSQTKVDLQFDLFQANHLHLLVAELKLKTKNCSISDLFNFWPLGQKRVIQIFEHTCAYARWALMHGFLSVRPSVCLSVCHWTKTQVTRK